MKRFWAILLSMVMVFALLPASAMAAGSKTIAAWEFSADAVTFPIKATSGDTTAELTRNGDAVKGVSYTASTGSVYCNTWNEIGAYWQFKLSTAGYQTISLDLKAWGTGTAPANWKLQYSSDGVNFTDLKTYTLTSTASTAYSFEFGTALDNLSAAYVRLVVVDLVSIKGETAAANGNARLAYVSFTGETYTGGDPAVSYSALNSAISTAEGLLDSTSVSEDGSDVADNAYWVTQNAYDALRDAVTTAKKALEATQQGDVDAATEDLNAAVDTFTAARAAGTMYVVMNIKEALDYYSGTSVSGVRVVGQVVYFYGNSGSENTTILQAKIDGEIYALQCYTTITATTGGDPVNIGDWVVINGTLGAYCGGTQMSSLISIDHAPESVAGVDASAPQEYESISAMLANYDNLVSEYVMLKNVTLGAYSDGGTTTVTDAEGNTIGIYMAAPYGDYFKAGDTVNLLACISAYNSTKQLRNGSTADYRMIGEDTAAPVITLPTFLDAEVGVNYYISATVADYSAIASVKLAYTIGGESRTADMEAGADNLYFYTIPAEQIVGGASAIEFTITATDSAAAANVGTASGSIAIIDLPQITDVTPAANSATGDDKRPVISAAFSNAGANPTVVMTVNDEAVSPTVADGRISYTPNEDLADGKYKVYVQVTRASGISAEKEWSFTVGEPDFRLYFGQLHSHTAQYSDGTGTLEQAYEHAQSAEQVDFLAVTDHSNYFDTSSNLGDMTDASKGKTTGDGSQTLWQEAKATASRYTKDDFIAIYGYEMTWSGQYGHMNTFNSVGIESRNNSAYVVKNGPGLVAYYDRLVAVANTAAEEGGSKTMNQFNHPGTTFGTFEDFAHYSVAYDELITMIEVGNGEGKVGGSMYWPSYEYYQLALDKGWHLAPTNNQDNHKGNWGDSNTARDVIYTDNFSEEGIYEAMENMTMYATEDNDLEVYYTLNGNVMGSVLSLEAGAAITINVSFNDPTDRVQSVSIIGNGGAEVAKKSFNTASGEWEFTFTLGADYDYSYFYIRVDEVDADIAVTAPVWVKETTKIGITSLEKDNVSVLLNEENGFTTTVYNYEAADYTVTKVEYSINDAVVYTDETAYTVATNSDFSGIKWNYVPTETGYQTLSVVVTAMFGTTEYKFNTSVTFTVRDASTMKTMLIDASHGNFYVSGNYADSDTAFIELAAEYGVNARHIGSSSERVEITDAVLEGCDLLVLTVPFTGADAAVTSYLYTDTEIAAIAKYAAEGGNIIITSKSDRRTPTAEAEYADVISNGLLEAVGAKARIGRGIVADVENNSNESYRLHFTGKEYYNFESYVNDNLIETTNTMFSAYNAAPVILNGAEWLVKAFDTTFVSSYKKYYTGSSYMPNPETERSEEYYAACGDQEDVVVMASETLPGGGFCITAGVTFFSTFEVQVEVENAGTLQNSNYQIVCNIFKMINPDAVTPISEIHEENTANKSYTIEGYVTSNASGHSQDTAFFDCIYVQDESGRGINVFPVSGDYQIGQKVRVTGVTSYYKDEIELNCGSSYGGSVRDITLDYAERADLMDQEIILANKQTISTYKVDTTRLQARLDEVAADNMTTFIEPDKADFATGYTNVYDYYMKIVSCGKLAEKIYTGNLVEISGEVTKVEYDANGVMGAIHVNDGTGTAVIFLDGYIYCDDGCTGYHDLSFVTVGATITARGIASVGENSYDDSSAIGARIRTRNRADIREGGYPDTAYTVNYIVNGVSIGEYTVTYGKFVTVPEVPAVNGYAGTWDIDLDGVAICSDFTVNAAYTLLGKLGDADCNGYINAKDAAAILRHLVDIETLSAQGLENAMGCDGNAGLSAADASAILRSIVGLGKLGE